ncbi:MAG: sigma-70 family RNA polymerase sigma factor [Planctomycetota bacterium]
MLDRDALGQLYREAYPTLRVIAAAEVGQAAADDVVQQAAIAAMERIERFDPGSNFKAWMASFVRNVARNHRRAEHRRTARDRKAGAGRAEAEIEPTPPTDPFDRSLQLALNQLSAEHRTCFLLRTVTDHSYQEIAAVLDIPESTARSHVYRARRRLAESLSSDPAGASS